ncbi:CheY-like chemotaxis protein [Variovorax boronicumulans]|uniref:CheY-like chemotaxis protein n=1 Tax=Variovorax boronicumulans TaxID=436515 RepID=A0AAW8CRC7_9BURK|nr:response regulator [Variovorax boronicumulans]MDP9891030.1 CheY-like chemotaxis protein [Variovorax boronicumulans]MDP9991447.1 CheY-like chemotaxis protein [Variovorax boronicumulans]MDQ0003189.1 CheY-like chemotaxis protein [Variovorax boronicumulans]MDQ0051097.1 CheY-like chemotaxis protein [Variovorax boronicumulans]
MSLITFLVEDNKTIRDNLVPALEDLVNGRVVGFAETESDALAWLAAHPDDWQLLIVDLFLKEGSGLGVLAGCKTRSEAQRVVVLSNYVTADIRARCKALGADAVFDKSRDLDAFIEYCNTDRPSGLAAL